MSKTLIVLPILGAWEWVTKCLHSLGDNTLPEHYDLCMIVNPSPEDATYFKDNVVGGVVDLINKTLPINDMECYILWQDKNLGVSKSWNTGIKHGLNQRKVEYDSYLFLNSDVIVFENWLSLMRTVMKTVDVELYCLQTELTEGGDPDFSSISVACRNNPEPFRVAQGINGPCFMLTQKAIDDVGLFDDGYEYLWCEDTDYLLRIRERGQQPVISTGSYAHHYHAKSRTKLKNAEKYKALNAIRFQRKWSVALPGSLDAKSFPPVESLRAEQGYHV